MNAPAKKPSDRISAAQYEAEMAAIIRLHVIKRQTPSEISEETGIPVYRIKDRLNRAGYSIVRLRPIVSIPVGSGEDKSQVQQDLDDALVASLVSAGGYPRLSEKLTRQGHVVCLPLIPYGARA